MVKKERNQDIDIMKGLLTLAMILCHCLQFFGKEDAGIEKILVNVINLTTFSGFLFCFGFVCCLAYFQGDTRRGIVHMLRNMIRLLLAFYISGLAYMAFKEQKIFRKDFIREVLTLRRYPGWSEFLTSFAAVLLVGALLLPALRKTNGWVVIGAAVVSLASCFIPYEKITNPWLALFIGSGSYTTFPVLQYGVYFVAGVWAAKRKKWPDWKLFFGAAILSTPCIWSWPFSSDGSFHRRWSPWSVDLSPAGRGAWKNQKRHDHRKAGGGPFFYRKKLVILSSHEQHSDLRCGRKQIQLPGKRICLWFLHRASGNPYLSGAAD